MLTVDDLDNLVTTPEAAERLGISQGMIRQWAARGKIKRVNPDGPRPVYRLIDVARAERDQRKTVLRGRVPA